jgi:hypothetical protein
VLANVASNLKESFKNHIAEVMEVLKGQYEKKLNNLWPEFNQMKRPVIVSP